MPLGCGVMGRKPYRERGCMKDWWRNSTGQGDVKGIKIERLGRAEACCREAGGLCNWMWYPELQLLVHGCVSRSWHLLGPQPAYVYTQPRPLLLLAVEGCQMVPTMSSQSFVASLWYCRKRRQCPRLYSLSLCLVLNLVFIYNAQLIFWIS